MNRRETCPVCGAPGLSAFFEMRGVPVLVNFLYGTREGAVGCPRGDIVLGFCDGCGFISNLAFDPSKFLYEEGYANPLHVSGIFSAYSRRLAEDLVDRFDLWGKKLVEIGCGDGTFLDTLCEIGGNSGTGFDPSYPASLPTRRERFDVVRDSYCEKYAGIEADFFCSRHTLEHIDDPKSLLRAMRSATKERTDVGLYIEVPNASYTLRNCFLWDVIYEHPSYFTSHSLARVLELSGLRVTRIYEAFSGQYLCAEAVSGGGEEDDDATRRSVPVGETRREVDGFAANCGRYVDGWKERLDGFRKAGKRSVVWGVGSKGITFLNVTDARDAVDCVVDINPKKQGKFVAGSGHEIVGPERLARTRPDVVIVANPVYKAEIEEVLRGLGLNAELVTL